MHVCMRCMDVHDDYGKYDDDECDEDFDFIVFKLICFGKCFKYYF